VRERLNYLNWVLWVQATCRAKDFFTIKTKKIYATYLTMTKLSFTVSDSSFHNKTYQSNSHYTNYCSILYIQELQKPSSV
jgi:hypothetical protein